LHKGTIFYINPINKKALRYFKKEFIESEIKNPKKLFIGSRLLYQDMILHSIKASVNEFKYNIDTFVEMKIYEDIGLDLNKNYKIGYILKDTQEENIKIIDAYAIEEDEIKNKFSPILEKSKHIDFLAIPFLSYKALYENNILEKENDIFINICENESFVAFYKKGEYISSKSLPTLNDILKDLKRVDPSLDLSIDSLKDLLFKKGLKKSYYLPVEYPLFEALFKIFSSIFTKISNIAIHNRNIYGFERVERVFFGIEDKTIKGVEEMLNLFSNNEITLYRHAFFKDITNFSQLDLICAIYIYDKAKNKDSKDNLTIFAKEHLLLKSETGRFIAFLAASIIILSSFPIYKGYQVINLQKEEEEISVKNEEIQNKSFFIKNKVENLQKKLNFVKKEVKIKEDKIAQIEKIVNSISTHIPKREYIKMIAEIDALLEKYRLQIEKIEQKGKKELTIKIVSKGDKRDTIAKFIRDINKKEEFKSATTDEIKLENQEYSSLVKIEK